MVSRHALSLALKQQWQAFEAKPQSRYLTSGEIALAYSVFADSLDVSEIQLKTAWWVLKNYAVSPNGNIYFHPADWCPDFSTVSIGKQSWLIHELTHVWQLQRGLKVVRGAIINRRYNYILQTGKSFFNYGIEQQARIVQDYFVRRQLGEDCKELEDCIPFLQAKTDNPSQATDNSFTI
ncbi:MULTISPECIES: type IV secretion protein Rhs [Psychrobacter]|uniref:type IV secretion protein Rhs n=1 Tax=Psychrobacter TaxID=497 RepID=UPI00191882BD|nr:MULTISPECIES: type IV secretion protein Rhs [Psychrobacter]